MKTVIINSQTTDPLSNACKRLIIFLHCLGYSFQVDKKSKEKISELKLSSFFRLTLIPCEVFEDLTLPFVVRVKPAHPNSDFYPLINDDDFNWFRKYLHAGTEPSKKDRLLLISRNQKIIAARKSQKEVARMQMETPPIPPIRQLTPALEGVQ